MSTIAQPVQHGHPASLQGSWLDQVAPCTVSRAHIALAPLLGITDGRTFRLRVSGRHRDSSICRQHSGRQSLCKARPRVHLVIVYTWPLACGHEHRTDSGERRTTGDSRIRAGCSQHSITCGAPLVSDPIGVASWASADRQVRLACAYQCLDSAVAPKLHAGPRYGAACPPSHRVAGVHAHLSLRLRLPCRAGDTDTE